ncbi:MAG: AgmX/PglI C-terminal domain-containing protein [Myxococcota bacterium]
MPVHLSPTAAVLPGAHPPPAPRPTRPTPSRSPASGPVDEPLFVGILTVLSLAAGLFWAWVVMTPPPEPLLVDADAAGLVRDLPPPVRLALEAPPVPIPVPMIVQGRARGPGRAPSAETTESAPADPTAARPRVLLDEWIGTLGAGTSPLDAILGDKDDPGLQQALDGVTGTREATLDGGMRQMARERDLSVGVGLGGGGAVGTGDAAAPTIRARVEAQAPETTVTAGGDAALIARTVRASQGRIVTCLERSLKADPTVSGRVSVSWTIRGGRVVEPLLVDNTTADPSLGACVVGAVRAMSFPKSLDAEVAEFPWVVAGG